MRSTDPTNSIRLLGLLAIWLCLGIACAPALPTCNEGTPCPAQETCRDGFCACPEAMARCDKACVNLKADTKNCGGCGTACSPGWRCLQGACACPQGAQACGNACVQLSTNPQHCGRCGKACAKGERCTEGQCRIACPAHAPTTCDAQCADLQSNPDHCGACNNVCKLGQGCIAGKCGCEPGWRSCGLPDGSTQCIDPMSNQSNCGKCKNDCDPLVCASGRCATVCPDNTPTNCFGGCFDTQVNRHHCGGCGQACRLDQRCVDGACTCPAGAIACGQPNGSGTRRCVDLRTTYDHCGRCGYACATGEKCAEGQCVPSCPSQHPTTCFGGCFDTQVHPDHCGKCGNQCSESHVCVKGQCTCPPDTIPCDNACIDAKTHPLHCGGCGKACGKGQACTGGKCVTKCPADSPLQCSGGCHNPSTSQAHCGKCGNACKGGQRCQSQALSASPSCQCAGGQTLCQGVCVDTDNDRLHCGKCGQLCPAGQGCQAGQCVLACGDLSACNGLCADTKTDRNHCGACGNKCSGNDECIGGTCQCAGGRLRCGGTCVDSQSDRNNCGACGTTCKPQQVCEQGTCQVLCANNKLRACQDLCVELDTDPDHCGKCDNACGTTQLCKGGVCTCSDAKTLCQTSCADLQNDPTNCGQCGKKCGNGEYCGEGTCKGCSAAVPVTCGNTCCTKGDSCCTNGQSKSCANFNTDPSNCGGCNKVCPAGQICQGGACGCKAGQTRACYTGPAGTKNKGICKEGTQTCSAGKWGACRGQITPGTETCNNKDDNCDGQIDETFANKGKACSVGVGACLRTSNQSCTPDGKGLRCAVSAAPPGPEVCDGQDNDCDGKTDETLSRSCYTGPANTAGVAACKAGTQTCSSGSWGACKGQVLPQKETCNNKDNNCDGQVDEGCTCPSGTSRPCGSKVGACKQGTQTCTSGTWGNCIGATNPKAETCDGIDNNCNGQIDDGLTPPPCLRQKGICKNATQRCAANGSGKIQWLACTAADYRLHNTAYQGRETKCDNLDNDCDGSVDEAINRACYTGPASTRNKGICKDGTQACSAGSWGLCTGETKPSTEVCDGKDNDCDGQLDESLSRTCYSGPNGTAGIGICKSGKETCSSGSWGSCVGQVTPTKESCNGKDDDCDGRIDESLSRNCYTGAAGTRNKGRCKDGTETCSAGSWGSCVGQVLPRKETCDTTDDDCDGKIDEGCSCTNGQTRACGSDVGACKKGSQTCSSGNWGSCVGEILPATETCNGKDDDCDGQTDETLSRVCYTGPASSRNKGLCKDGTQTCSAGSWGSCVGQVLPKTETCNNKDDDCDGQLDESLSRTCYSGPSGTAGRGICKSGKETCSSGSWGSCVGQVTPTKESCNNKDDDCDGQVDETLNRSCYSGASGTSGVGICRAGTQACAAGNWGKCVGQVLPKTETCNTTDDDCDGKIDEGCSCVDGQTRACGSDVGACKKGTQTCRSGNWGKCVGEITPTPEICDNKDNDCDKSIDEGLSQACYTGGSGTAGVGVCKTGTHTCSRGSWGKCVGEITPTPESCNNKDDNCNGQVDETLSRSCYTGTSATLNVGVCRAGLETCRSGGWGACVGEITPTPESCNNKDDDCDGLIDESLTKLCYTGKGETINVGVCRAGLLTCRSGSWGKCVGEVTPTPEVCNLKDDDCDGKIDEGLEAVKPPCTPKPPVE